VKRRGLVMTARTFGKSGKVSLKIGDVSGSTK